MADAKRRDRRGFIVPTLILLLICLGAIGALSSNLFRSASVDLTQDKVFTLSPGTIKVLQNMQEPVTLRLFVSPDLVKKAPTYGPYVQRTKAILDRYRELANGKIKVEIYEPARFSNEEDRASGFGLSALPVDQQGTTVFFGLAATNSVDETEKIAFFHPNREAYIEQDLTRIILTLSVKKKKVVGMISRLPLAGRFSMQGMQPPWPIYKAVDGIFEVKTIAPTATEIPKDIDVLWIVHPLGIPAKLRYAIDQYVLKGGKTIVMVDPVPEAAPRRRSMFGMSPVSPGSDLPDLFKAWGVEMVKGKVAADIALAVKVRWQEQGRPVLVDYVAWLELPEAQISQKDPASRALSRVILASPGIIRKLKDGKTTVEPLLVTTDKAEELDARKLRIRPNPVALERDYKPGGKVLTMAARITGPAVSAFPKGPPEDPKKKDDPKKADDKAGDKKADDKKADDKKTPAKPAHLATSAKPIDVVIFADIDMIEGSYWQSEQRLGNETLSIPTSDNANLILNLIDSMSGANALLGLRSKGQASRPFTEVRKIQKASEERFRAKQAELIKKRDETIKKLRNVRTSGKDGQVVLTKEQQEAIQQFRTELIRIRAELREVQYQQSKDINALETRVKVWNIAAIPAVIAVFAIFIGFVRHRRRRRRHETG